MQVAAFATLAPKELTQGKGLMRKSQVEPTTFPFGAAMLGDDQSVPQS